VIPTVQEIGAGVAVMIASVTMGVVATAAGDVAPFDIILREWGPLGAAVFVLYRRVDKLEQRIQQNAREIDDIDG
jgi:hypothetical protein